MWQRHEKGQPFSGSTLFPTVIHKVLKCTQMGKRWVTDLPADLENDSRYRYFRMFGEDASSSPLCTTSATYNYTNHRSKKETVDRIDSNRIFNVRKFSITYLFRCSCYSLLSTDLSFEN